MMNFDENALICDLAETYHIYDYRSLPVQLVATLSAGLRDNSRIKLAKAGLPVSQDTALLAIVADRIDGIRYMLADDESKKKYPPVSIVEIIFGEGGSSKDNSGLMRFSTPEAFEAYMTGVKGE